jgi:hypothetical protein
MGLVMGLFWPLQEGHAGDMPPWDDLPSMGDMVRYQPSGEHRRGLPMWGAAARASGKAKGGDSASD